MIHYLPYLALHLLSVCLFLMFYTTFSSIQEQQCTTVNEQQCDTVTETTYENECTTVQEQKCEIQYMTQYEQQCTTQNENVSFANFQLSFILFNENNSF